MNHVIVTAEIGCNHQGSIEIAKRMIREAKVCGCDYVKMQKRDIDSLPKELGDKPYLGEHSFGATYREHRQALEFNEEQWKELQSFAKSMDIGFFGTAFDLPSAEMLCRLKMPYLKIGSMQCRDLEFLRSIISIQNHPPLLISTGMCDEDNVDTIIRDYLSPSKGDILIHTTSSYPCPENEVNLVYLRNMGRPGTLGLSGHYSAGNGAIEAAAVALGATYIERHFTLDRTWKGTDQAVSLEPIGMMNVVKAIRTVEKALGDGIKRVMPSEEPIIKKLMCR